MDPDPDAGLRDSRNNALQDHRQLSQLDDHNSFVPLVPFVSYPPANHDVPAADADAHHAAAPLEPDDFYKSYRVASFNSHPEDIPMATSVERQSLRSNGDGTTPRHPPLPVGRNLARPNLRSVSSPLENNTTTPTSSRFAPPGQPSVKDLTKRFDQHTSPSSIPRAPLRPDACERMRQDPPKATAHNGPAAYANMRSGISSSPDSQHTTSSGRAQRPKYVAQDHVSSNSQSFASRVGKPRSAANENSIASKSMTHLPHKSPPQPSQPFLPQSSSPLSTSHSQGLLFGEILPEQGDTSAVGYGIDSARPRRTSESSVHEFSLHQRSLSNPDAEPSSPIHWYRDNIAYQQGTPASLDQRAHGRSQSDFSASKSTSPIIRLPAVATSSSSASNRSTSVSKIPISVKRLNSPTSSSSPSSTRSNSPSTHKRSHANGRIPKVTTFAPGSKTPTQSGRKRPPQVLVTPNNSTRLQAYIGIPPPKLSPPLRSSRPRQPVSLASTASSRMKGATRAKSPFRPNGKDTSPRSNDNTPRRRKISVGPIDFEQRREHIRLAYTKSIRESQALEARQRAAERRRREMEEANKAKSAAAAITLASVLITGPESQEFFDTVIQEGVVASQTEGAESKSVAMESCSIPVLTELDRTVSDSLEMRAFQPLETSIPLVVEQHSLPSTDSHDSPTLGLPGSFPDLSPPAKILGRPLSAISATSATTEFDEEPQIESPVQTRSSMDIPISLTTLPSPTAPNTIRQPIEYQYPFTDEPESLQQSPTVHETAQQAPQPVVPRSHYDAPPIPSTYRDSYDGFAGFKPLPHQSYGTTVTILPPARDDLISSEDAEATIPFPRLDIHDESDCHSETDSVPPVAHSLHFDNDDAATDACTEETDDRDGADDQRSDYRFGDHLSSHRASTCASSDTDTFDKLLYPLFDHQPAAVSSNTLMVPPNQSQVNRLSRQSAWTDFSIDSTDRSDGQLSPTIPIEQTLPYTNATVTAPEESNMEDDRSLKDISYSGPALHHSSESNRSSAYFHSQHLPELDTGDGFSIPYLSPDIDASFSYLPSPSHDPPPVPPSASGSALNSRTSSVLYEQSHYGSTLINSERVSQDFLSRTETLQSLDTSSADAVDQYSGSPTPADSDAKSLSQDSEEPTGKERHRLTQRRNVLKELVDTEAVFVRDMNIVEEIYKGTAEACPKLDSKTVKLIFRNSDEIISFHTTFLAQIKEAAASVYIPQGGRSPLFRDESIHSETASTHTAEISDARDRATLLGPVFQSNVESLKLAHEGFLRNSDQAAKKLIEIQQDSTVKVWLNECNEVAKDLTAAWDLDSLLIKPMQRITKYPNLIITLLQHTPADHPDREALVSAKDALEEAIVEINKTKKNFELVGQIVGRKRKESDVKAGLARAFGKRVDKLQTTANRPPEDPEYAKLEERFGDDYLRLQVVLRDVEFYTRQVSAYVHEFLQYLSAIELVMRLQPGNYPELESKWVQFNISMRDLEKVALEEHLSQVRKHVIEPFELVIKAYGNPSLAMKKRQKRRVVYERSEQLKRAGKSIDPKLKELVEQYDALNDTLLKELPKLSALTEKVGNICLGNLINIQTNWYGIWKEKMKTVLSDAPEMPDLKEVLTTFERDFPYAHEQLASIAILNPNYWGRASQSTTASGDDALLKARSRASESDTRGRNLTLNGETAPTLPAPDFGSRNSGAFTVSPSGSTTGVGAANGADTVSVSSPHQYYYRDYYNGLQNHQTISASPRSPGIAGSSRSLGGTGQTSTRPSTGRSYDSGALPRPSSESVPQLRRDSNTTYNSSHQQQENHRYSNLFHSALPLPDGPEESRQSSRASSRERAHTGDGYNILWLAASLFEFNISTTKHEAGYPYLTYQAGEIFDVIAEKGELWLAKNQDDSTEQVGWIWSKHFAKLADA